MAHSQRELAKQLLITACLDHSATYLSRPSRAGNATLVCLFRDWAGRQARSYLGTPREADLHHIRIITPCVTPNLRSAEELRALERDGIRVTHSHISTGPVSIESEFDAAYCQAGTVRSAIEAQAEGADAIIIDCMGDPAVNACRERLNILVLGPGETSMQVAAMLGLRFSIVTVMDSVVPMLENLAAVYGLTRKLASVRSINVPVLEIHEDRAALQEALLSQCRRAIVDDGAHSIVLGCTGFLGCAEALSAALDASSLSVPVVDPIPTTVYVASALLSARLRPSRRTYLPPRDKPLMGYELPPG